MPDTAADSTSTTANVAGEPAQGTPETASGQAEKPTSAASESTQTTPPATPPPPRRLKVKIDEQESELDEEEVVRGYQRAQAANKRMQEAAELRKSAKKDYERLVRDPFGTVVELLTPHFGKEAAEKHIRALAQQRLQALHEEEQLPEDQKILRQLQRERDEWRNRYETEQKRKEDEEHFQVLKKYQDEFTTRLSGAMKSGGLPEDEETIAELIPMLQSAIEKEDDLTPEDAVAIVKERREERRRKILESLSEDEILQDAERAKRLNARLLKAAQDKLRAPSSTQEQANQKGSTSQRRASEKKQVSTTDFFNNW